MQDVRGDRSYHRLRRGWNLLTAAVFGFAVLWSPTLLDIKLQNAFKANMLLGILVLGFLGSLLAASGSVAGAFRRTCLLLACNFPLLLNYDVWRSRWGATPWVTLLFALWLADRTLRREMGIAPLGPAVPPGCLAVFVIVPFLWPALVFFGTVGLTIYLLVAYPQLLAALPRPQKRESHLTDSANDAIDAITRT